MTIYHALVVDDMPDILEDVRDRLEALGHSCDCAGSLVEAREFLQNGSYSYVLLDLEIPVRYGRPSRIPNGQNLLMEIRAIKGYETIPIIVMTSHGHDSPNLAIEVLRGNGATDYVKKPFADSGYTLEKAIREGLASSGRSRPGAKKQSSWIKDMPPQRFEEGRMVFYPSHVELCDVKICGGADSGMIRQILDQLRNVRANGKFVKYSGDEMARRIGCERGQNGIAEVVRDFRNSVSEIMLNDANIKIDRLYDIILNDRRYGYRLSPKITVHDADEPVNEPQSEKNDGQNDPVNNLRQHWVMDQLDKGSILHKADIMDNFQCSASTAERDLRNLRKRGLIKFIGPAKTGHWIKKGLCT